MHQGLRTRIAAVALVSTASSLVAVLLLVGPGLRARTTDHLRDRLVAEARLIARVVAEPMAGGIGSAELDTLVDSAARDVRARVTVIDVDGRVLADSAASGVALLSVENHGTRPEVEQARAVGVGSAVRRSSTVDEELLYAAVAIRPAGRFIGVARLALPLDEVEGRVADLRRAVAAVMVLAFVLTALWSAMLAPTLAGPLREMMEAAHRFAAGDLNARLPVARRDELGELARLLNQALEQLQDRFVEAARDRARMHAILAAMDDGVLAIDHAGRVVLANDSLRRITGGDEPVGLHYLEVLRQRAVAQLAQEVLRTGRAHVMEEATLRQAGRQYAVTAVPFPGVEGGPQGAVLTFHDITDRQRLERIRRDFVANASHELRTPLTSIRGFVEALEDGAVADPTTSARFLEKIRRHADRMTSLVDDLLELSRIESGGRAPEQEQVVLAEVAEEVVSSITETARRKSVKLSLETTAAPAVTGDGERLRRILVNLVDNAVKYTTEGGKVTVRVAPTGSDGVRVEVEDDGPGIPPEHLPRIFERFYRVDKARSRELGGTGLGLSIVRHLAESIGVSVSVTSEVGRGTTFVVHVPAASPMRNRPPVV